MYAFQISTSNILMSNSSDVSNIPQQKNNEFLHLNITKEISSSSPCICDPDSESENSDFCDSIVEDINMIKHISLGTFVTLLLFISFLCMATVIDVCCHNCRDR